MAGSRRTRATTSCPAFRKVADMDVPIMPEAPEIRMRMLHLTTDPAPGTSRRAVNRLTMIKR
ncbi:hypothetical protein NtRootA9_16290 [Arthrobacter sp. NtRootA9]|nr:hypothetical protein NtRootA9_16290 [Arthrobacter sp. NtRootA9]